MATLRLTPTTTAAGAANVTVHYRDAAASWQVLREVASPASDEDLADIRWFFEERPGRKSEEERAASTRRRVREIGETLFVRLLGAEDEAAADLAEIRRRLRRELASTDVVVGADDPAGHVPWELLRDPVTGTVPALDAASFSHAAPAAAAAEPAAGGPPRPIRLLLVICRPLRERDIPFLNVAGRLLAHSRSRGGRLHLTVLRPPTFPRLAEVLRAAHADRTPFDVVHFDGHGLHDRAQAGDPGVLLFEDPGSPLNEDYIDGRRLGGLLAETGVRLLVMNACRSAVATVATDDGREQSTGDSVAAQVASGWPVAVVAMRYDVFEDVAADFVEALFRALADGHDVRRATSVARRALTVEDPDGGRSGMEWAVPVVLSSTPVRFSTAPDAAGQPPAAAAGPVLSRDEVVLRLDQAFQGAGAVLLHGPAGIGRTTLAHLFGWWYRATEAVDWWWETDLREPDGRAALDTPPGAGPGLVVWDNVDAVPDGGASDAVVRVLGECRARGVKVLMTARGPDRVPAVTDVARVEVPRLSYRHATRLAALRTRVLGAPALDVHRVMDMVEFSEGVPLAVVAGVDTLARAADATPDEAVRLCRAVVDGELIPQDDDGAMARLAGELTAVVDDLDDESRLVLAQLHLFRGEVLSMALLWIRDRDKPDASVNDRTVELLAELLDPLVERGFLIEGVRRLVYVVHPAARQATAAAFAHLLAATPDAERAAKRSYVEATGMVGDVAFRVDAPHPELAATLGYALERNLWHAFDIVRAEGWTELLTEVTQGLRNLLRRTGRYEKWAHVVDVLAENYLDPESGGPREGVEPDWPLAMNCLIEHARDTGQDERARALLERALPTYRDLAAPGLGALRAGPDLSGLTETERYHLASYGSTLMLVAEATNPPGTEGYEAPVREAQHIATAVEDEALLTASTCNLAVSLAVRGDYRQAEAIVRDVLAGVTAEGPRAVLLSALASALYQRWQVATGRRPLPPQAPPVGAAPPEAEVLNALRRAVAAAPETAFETRASAHLDLANMLDDLGRQLLAIEHYGEALELYTAAGADYQVAVAADNISMSYERIGHRRNALHYALRAYAGYQRHPEQAGPFLERVFWRIDRLGADVMVDRLGVDGTVAALRALLPDQQPDEQPDEGNQ